MTNAIRHKPIRETLVIDPIRLATNPRSVCFPSKPTDQAACYFIIDSIQINVKNLLTNYRHLQLNDKGK